MEECDVMHSMVYSAVRVCKGCDVWRVWCGGGGV